MASALIGFVASHGDAELLEFAEEILDQMSPFIDFLIYGSGRVIVSAFFGGGGYS